MLREVSGWAEGVLHGASTLGSLWAGRGRQALPLPTLCALLREDSPSQAQVAESTCCIRVFRHSCVCSPLCLSHIGEGAQGTRRWPPVPTGTSVVSAVTILSPLLQAGVGRKPGPLVFFLHA